MNRQDRRRQQKRTRRNNRKTPKRSFSPPRVVAPKPRDPSRPNALTTFRLGDEASDCECPVCDAMEQMGLESQDMGGGMWVTHASDEEMLVLNRAMALAQRQGAAAAGIDRPFGND